MHEAINVQTCLLCGAHHTYKILFETERDDSTLGLPLRKRRRKFQGAFPCPVTNKSYRSATTLLVPPGERISSVNLAGVEAA